MITLTIILPDGKSKIHISTPKAEIPISTARKIIYIPIAKQIQIPESEQILFYKSMKISQQDFLSSYSLSELSSTPFHLRTTSPPPQPHFQCPWSPSSVSSDDKTGVPIHRRSNSTPEFRRVEKIQDKPPLSSRLHKTPDSVAVIYPPVIHSPFSDRKDENYGVNCNNNLISLQKCHKQAGDYTIVVHDKFKANHVFHISPNSTTKDFYKMYVRKISFVNNFLFKGRAIQHSTTICKLFQLVKKSPTEPLFLSLALKQIRDNPNPQVYGIFIPKEQEKYLSGR